jgi:hypothetical protein
MEKRGYFIIGLMLIAFSLVLICSYLTTGKEFTTAVLSMAIGEVGIILLCLSEKVNGQAAILSAIMLFLGGFLIPSFTLIEELSTTLTAILYGAASLLLIILMLESPQKTKKETSVQQ